MSERIERIKVRVSEEEVEAFHVAMHAFSVEHGLSVAEMLAVSVQWQALLKENYGVRMISVHEGEGMSASEAADDLNHSASEDPDPTLN